MVAQCQMFNVNDYKVDIQVNLPNKRVHYKIPSYTKSYQVEHTNIETGQKVTDSDEKHIFRLKTLYKLYEQIANYIPAPFDLADGIYFYQGLVYSVYRDEKGQLYNYQGKQYITQAMIEKLAYIKGQEMTTIKERLHKHINLLRGLKKGLTIEEAISYAN